MTRRPPTDRREPPAAPVILVVGMGRSGTSATASVLASLGLALPKEDDLLGRHPSNQAGHFESISLLAENDDLLRRLGGSWDDPPPLPTDPVSSEELAPVATRAAATFRQAFGDPNVAVCWKDPRTTLLLPFWRQVIGRPIACVFCVRHPLEVARSLERRDGLELPVGLALWERYQHRAVTGLTGLPVYVTSYAYACRQPEAWREDLRRWLGWLQLSEFEKGGGSSAGSNLGIDPVLRNERIEDEQAVVGPEASEHPDVAAVVLGQQQSLYEELLELRGPHTSFDHELTTPESPWTAYLLEQRRDSRRVWQSVDWLTEALANGLRLPVEGITVSTPEAPSRSPYPPNATEDHERYTDWLRKRGEPARASSDTAASVTAARAAPAVRRNRRNRRGEPATTPADETALHLRAGRGIAKAAHPLFSVIVACHRTPLDLLDRCVASVLAQDCSDWELCLCDDASGDPRLTRCIAELAALDRRIRTVARDTNGGVSVATNDALALAVGRYAVFLDHDDELHPSALDRVARAIADEQEADLIYSDEDKIDETGLRHTPSFKPAWSPDLLLSNAYMGHVLVVRRDLLTTVGGLRSNFDGAQDYDLMLRVSEVTSAIVHIPEILYHRRSVAGSSYSEARARGREYEAGRRALEDAAARRAIDATVVHHPVVPGSYHFIRRPSSGHLVSAIIPFRDEPALTAACYRSFIEQPGYDNFELLLVDNDSALPETRALLEDLARDHRVRLVAAPGPFDWAAINQEAARKARGELLLFLNNDIEARSRGWLAALVAQAERPEVGAVGARLLYPDGTIQHAGVIVGAGRGVSHVQQGLSADQPGYLSLTTVTRNTSAVTGACLMTRRSVFEELGGFDANLPIAFSDIDYCLRLREKGLFVVYTPLAELIHYESKSRGHTGDPGEIPFFRNRWRSLLLSGDPYYNPNLGRFDNNCRLPTEGDEAKWETFLSTLSESSTS
ncbi:MAG: glycosyltransferase [Acidimicrobiales bacterium]